MVDAEISVVEPAERYLAHLTAFERSPDTVKVNLWSEPVGRPLTYGAVQTGGEVADPHRNRLPVCQGVVRAPSDQSEEPSMESFRGEVAPFESEIGPDDGPASSVG